MPCKHSIDLINFDSGVKSTSRLEPKLWLSNFFIFRHFPKKIWEYIPANSSVRHQDVYFLVSEDVLKAVR